MTRNAVFHNAGVSTTAKGSEFEVIVPDSASHIFMRCDQQLRLLSSSGNVQGGSSLDLTAVGDATMVLGSGKSFKIKDDGGQHDLSDRRGGTFHIKTGATWVADL